MQAGLDQRAPNLCDRLLSRIAPLDEDGRSPRREPHALLIVENLEVLMITGISRVSSVRLEPVENFKTGHVGQDQVEKDHVGAVRSARRRSPPRCRPRSTSKRPRAARSSLSRYAIAFLVVDDQGPCPGKPPPRAGAAVPGANPRSMGLRQKSSRPRPGPAPGVRRLS